MKKSHFLLFVFYFTISSLEMIHAQMIVPLWPEGQTPNSLNNQTIKEKNEVGADGILRISDITVPSFAVYKAAKPTGTAVIICPGGGYRIEAANHEGTNIAKWFNSFGITAFVLKYRLPDERLWANRHEVAFQDVLQALRLIKSGAKKYDIDPNKVGVMGFSAGGHLASTLSTHWFKDLPSQAFGTAAEATILMYPVISSGEHKHAGSFEQLLGKEPKADLLDYYSTEKQVTTRTPPTLLIHATDDKAVPVENSLMYYAALKKVGVPASLLIYENGGHGFGMAQKQNSSVKNWTEHARQWLEAMGF
jgi:acetyl esterase/lipase